MPPQTFQYGEKPRQALDIYRPQKTRVPAPVLIFFYGGSWKSGSRKLYRLIGQAFASRGYLVAIPDYRLFPEAVFPDFMHDAALALKWVTDHAGELGADKERICVMGHSAGAHIGALLCLSPRWLGEVDLQPGQINGFVGLAGPYTLNPLKFDSVREIFESHPEIDEARPIKNVHANAPPMMLAHGRGDKTVGHHNSENLCRAIRDAGGRAELRTYPRVGHIAIMAALMWPFRIIAPIFKESLGALKKFDAAKTDG